MEKEYGRQDVREESLSGLLDICGHYFAHRVGGSRRGRGKIMELIAKHPGITQKELAEELGIQAASVSELLMKLEHKGLVLREKDETDRRVTRVRLTADGLAEMEGKEEAVDPFQALSDSEQETLKKLLRKLIADWEERYPQERGGRRGGGHHGHHGHNRGESRR